MGSCGMPNCTCQRCQAEWCGDVGNIVYGGGSARHGQALLGTAYVTHDRGRWVVWVWVEFPDQTVVRRITDYHTRRRAEVAADLIERTMNR